MTVFCVLPGPATVRMISHGPPYPMPMQVPPGHMVQQIVDENGVLTHVILSQGMPPPHGMAPPPPGAAPTGMPAGAPMTVGYCVSITQKTVRTRADNIFSIVRQSVLSVRPSVSDLSLL